MRSILPPLTEKVSPLIHRKATNTFFTELENEYGGHVSPEMTSSDDDCNIEYHFRNVNASDYHRSNFPSLLGQIGPPPEYSTPITTYQRKVSR